jgi:hypothetical protein
VSAPGHMTAPAIAMSGTTLGTAGIGGEVVSLGAALGPSPSGKPWLEWLHSTILFGSLFDYGP